MRKRLPYREAFLKRAAQRGKGLSRSRPRMCNPLYSRLRNHSDAQQCCCLEIELPRITYAAEQCFITIISAIRKSGTSPQFKSRYNQTLRNSGPSKVGMGVPDSYRSAQCPLTGQVFRNPTLENCVPKANMGQPP